MLGSEYGGHINTEHVSENLKSTALPNEILVLPQSICHLTSSRFRSHPIYVLPSFLAASDLAPQPANGSTIVLEDSLSFCLTSGDLEATSTPYLSKHVCFLNFALHFAEQHLLCILGHAQIASTRFTCFYGHKINPPTIILTIDVI
nr:MAG TPA: hypothetical protein [Caudoviricetes sp.]